MPGQPGEADVEESTPPRFRFEPFGFAVKDQREAPGLMQEEFAGRADIHRSYGLEIERGTRNVSLVKIERLAEALTVTISELFLPPTRSGTQPAGGKTSVRRRLRG